MAKTAKQMERHFKGIANHYRIQILLMLAQDPGMTVFDIADRLQANKKTISQHTRFLFQAGLLNKKYRGKNVENTLSPYGKRCVQFIKMFRELK